MQDEILTIAEVCSILRIGRSTLLKLIHSGEMPAFKVGRQWRIFKDGLYDFLEKGQMGTKKE